VFRQALQCFLGRKWIPTSTIRGHHDVVLLLVARIFLKLLLLKEILLVLLDLLTMFILLAALLLDLELDGFLLLEQTFFFQEL
jgi:hypothetical protein